MNLTGKKLGQYQILEEVGRGGMGIVYRAYQPSLHRYVAIKILPPGLALDRQFVQRFLREARSAAQLRHPNIVVIHDVEEERGLYYIVMEYLSGQTLAQLIARDGPLPPRRALHLLEQAAHALDYAHARSFIHRDVKPANLFVDAEDHLTLTDFGIAKASQEAHHLTGTGVLVGTPEYMSPEQAGSGKVDHRTDLYALGVVLYQMLTGRVPFRGTTPHATLHAVIYEPPPRPRALNPRLPVGVESVLLKAVDKRPERRFQRGADLVSAFRAAWRRRSQKRSISPLLLLLGGLAAVLVLILSGLLLALESRQPAETPASSAPTYVSRQSPTIAERHALVSSREVTAAPSGLPTQESGESGQPRVEPTQRRPTATLQPQAVTRPPTATRTARPTARPKTPTATTQPSPVPSPLPTACPMAVTGPFASLWQAHRDRLGCPLHSAARVIQDAEQPFQNGHMFWRAEAHVIYVIYEVGSLAGTYQRFQDTWKEGDPAFSCGASPPPGLVQPERGFGRVWCQLGAQNAAIGWGLGTEGGFGAGIGDPLVQEFQQGVIFRDSDGTSKGMAYLLFGDGTWLRTRY